jgi:hypothetical protein
MQHHPPPAPPGDKSHLLTHVWPHVLGHVTELYGCKDVAAQGMMGEAMAGANTIRRVD